MPQHAGICDVFVVILYFLARAPPAPQLIIGVLLKVVSHT